MIIAVNTTDMLLFNLKCKVNIIFSRKKADYLHEGFAHLGERNDNYSSISCLEHPMDRGAWQATVHRVPKIRHDWATEHTHTHTHTHTCSPRCWSIINRAHPCVSGAWKAREVRFSSLWLIVSICHPFPLLPKWKMSWNIFFTTIPSFEEVFKCSKKCVFIFQSSL